MAKLLGADGSEQAASPPVELTVADGQIVVATPAPAAAATVVPVAGAPTIKLPAAGLKATEPVTLEGTGEPGTTVTLYDGEQVVAETTVAPDGTWTLTVPPLAAGADNLVAKLLGADGSEQAASPPVELTVADGQIVVATPAPAAAATAVPGAATAAPTVTPGTIVLPTAAAVAGAATAVATAATGLPSTTATPAVSVPMVATPVGAAPDAGATMTLEGTGAPGATVKVYDSDILLGEATVGADGKWTMTMPTLAAGPHSLVAKLFGADGKEQAASPELSVTVSAGPGAKLSVLPVINPPAGGKLSASGTTELAGLPPQVFSLSSSTAATWLGRLRPTRAATGRWWCRSWTRASTP